MFNLLDSAWKLPETVLQGAHAAHGVCVFCRFGGLAPPDLIRDWRPMGRPRSLPHGKSEGKPGAMAL
eukprot:15439318-Alexandrium_andersonii.AAC.1